jgi:hypothetical protein
MLLVYRDFLGVFNSVRDFFDVNEEPGLWIHRFEEWSLRIKSGQ